MLQASQKQSPDVQTALNGQLFKPKNLLSHDDVLLPVIPWFVLPCFHRTGRFFTNSTHWCIFFKKNCRTSLRYACSRYLLERYVILHHATVLHSWLKYLFHFRRLAKIMKTSITTILQSFWYHSGSYVNTGVKVIVHAPKATTLLEVVIANMCSTLFGRRLLP